MLIYLIAGEPSGDMLGGRLMHALKEMAPDARFAGIGGENMEREGLKSLFDISDLAVMGLAEVIPSIPKILRHIKETIMDIAAQKPDIVITIDSWSFSARVHKALRKKGIKVLQMHYVAPQVWAWKKGRAKTMYKYIDRLLTLFPNEPAYFTPYRLPADCVGHPVVENQMLTADPKAFFAGRNVAAGKRVVLILPGSRHNEVSRLLPVFLESAKILNTRFNDLYFVLPTVKTVEKRVRKMVASNPGLPVEIVDARTRQSVACGNGGDGRFRHRLAGTGDNKSAASDSLSCGATDGVAGASFFENQIGQPAKHHFGRKRRAGTVAARLQSGTHRCGNGQVFGTGRGRGVRRV